MSIEFFNAHCFRNLTLHNQQLKCTFNQVKLQQCTIYDSQNYKKIVINHVYYQNIEAQIPQAANGTPKKKKTSLEHGEKIMKTKMWQIKIGSG